MPPHGHHGGGDHHGGGHGHHGGGLGPAYGPAYGPAFWYPEPAYAELVPTCPDVYNPVKATDGRVYDNECLARSAGAAVVKRVRSKPAAVGDLFDPVAGFVSGIPNIALLAGGVAIGYALYRRGASTKRRIW